MKTDNRLIQDDDGHWYIIPYDKEDEFYDFLEEYSNNPEWAIEIDGPHSLIIKDYMIV